MKKAELTFIGANHTVTGSATLLKYNGNRYLIDCGMFQGPKQIRRRNWETYSKEFVQSLDAVILTHAHVDHSAMVPKLFQFGYRGPVYCTHGTQDLAEVLLPDTAYLLQEDARRKSSASGKRSEPLFSSKEAMESLKLFQPLPRHEWHDLREGLSFRFIRAGHILGSSIVQFSMDKGNGIYLLTFSGDLGNNRQRVIKGPEEVMETDALVLETTYGDRIQPKKEPEQDLEEAIRSIQKSGGALVIPAFAVGRTQEILYMVRKIFEQTDLPKIDVYLDSPMALEATELYVRGGDDLKLRIDQEKVQPALCPPSFIKVKRVEDSMRLVHKSGPIIIISAAGMLTGGRILYHLKERLPDPNSIVLFVGYQAEETKGRLLQQGLKTIRIHKELIPVKAEIKTVEALSAHADSDELVDWVSKIEKKPSRIFLNHGELTSSRALAYRLKYELDLDSEVPASGETFQLF